VFLCIGRYSRGLKRHPFPVLYGLAIRGLRIDCLDNFNGELMVSILGNLKNLCYREMASLICWHRLLGVLLCFSRSRSTLYDRHVQKRGALTETAPLSWRVLGDE